MFHRGRRGFTLIESPAVRKRGFTLIELLVVIAIIAILTATASDVDGKPMTRIAVLWALPLIVIITALISLLLLILIIRYAKKYLKFVPGSDKPNEEK